MKKIVYSNPPRYDEPEKYRDYIAKSCEYSCVYCSLVESENLGATFNIDHFKPKVIFPSLYADCNNLRYSCPRCNSYKRAKWISKEQGCVRDCDSCENRVCKKDIPRFIDCLVEEPRDFIESSPDYKLLAKNNSKVAQYTIEALRLNRVQLIKMRHFRAELNELYSDVQKMSSSLAEKKDEICSLRNDFEKYKVHTSKENDLIGVVDTLFEMILLIIQQEETYLEHIATKLNTIRINRNNSEKSEWID